MDLVSAAPGDCLHSITIGRLPGPNTQGTFYYPGVPVTEGQVIDLPAMNGNAIPGFTFKPAPNFSGDVNLNFDYVIASHRTGPAALPEEGTSVIAVDSVADMASGQSEFDGRDGTGNSIIMPGASVDNQGWSVHTAAPEQAWTLPSP